jgi:hypothetical protein
VGSSGFVLGSGAESSCRPGIWEGPEAKNGQLQRGEMMVHRGEKLVASGPLGSCDPEGLDLFSQHSRLAR